MDNDEAKQTGATPRSVNLAPRPLEPMFVDVMRSAYPSYIKENNYAWMWEDTDRWVIYALWVLNKVDSPAELEEAYQKLRPLVADVPRFAKLIDDIYTGMWHYFLGGLS